MYPDPTEALPLPPQPDPEQYRKRAKDLVKACRSQDPGAIDRWAVTWIGALADLTGESGAGRRAGQVADFARARLSGGGRSSCRLSDAQFVLARAHGFASWAALVTHLESLPRANSPVSAFEAAADAIVTGDAASLERLLREHPGLARARSTREHHATLLHYVSANGVEGYRQKSPANAVTIARMLLDAGAEVDADAAVYGGGCTTLGLVATSVHPQQAGVQRELMDLLLKRGARTDLPGVAGNRQMLVRACLANGQPGAAEYLADRGAPLDLPAAAGVGRIDIVREALAADGPSSDTPAQTERLEALAHACAYGRAEVAAFLIDSGIDVNAELALHGRGHTGLHVAAYRGHPDVVDVLLRRGARLDVVDRRWGTPPLVWALTGWSHRPSIAPARYSAVVALLVAAGAAVTPELVEWAKARGPSQILSALAGEVGPDGKVP